ncbi:MAG: hypothetical protein ABI981_03720 [Betaproteobacteria bacterium]
MINSTMRLIACIFSALTLLAPSSSFAQKAAPTATQFYMQYRDAWLKAASIDALLPYLSKDGRTEIEATPADKRQVMFQMMKAMGTVTDVKVVKETKQDDGYLLDLTGVAPDKSAMTGRAEIIMEGGAMKLKKESWKS